MTQWRNVDLQGLADEMRTNSERWFPQWHDGSIEMSLRVAYALGLAGEGGELANAMKKLARDGDSYERRRALEQECADVFTYLLLLCDECNIDLVTAYEHKRSFNEGRWG